MLFVIKVIPPPGGERAVLEHTLESEHTDYSVFKVLGIGFIRLFEIIGSFISEKMIDCLNILKKENKGKKFMLILNNCSVHKSNVIKKWLRDGRCGKRFIEFKFLPPYCPDLNSVEFFNNDLKHSISKRVC